MLGKNLFNHNNIEKDNEAFHPISSDDTKIIGERGNLEIHEILQFEARVQCTFCHKYSEYGVTICDCGSILKCISAQEHDQVRMIVTQSLAGRSKRLTENKKAQDYNRAKKHVGRAIQFEFKSFEERWQKR